ncbi:MAG: ribonuclease P protein component [Candidatus Babeliaceae bacterium]|jgi:ribonuclease P protein component
MTLWSKREIQKLFRTSKRLLHHPGLDIKIAPRSGDIGRLLVVISRKVGSAPQRNLIRRRIKAIFYENKLFEKGFDWIFFTKPAATALTYSDMHGLIDHILTQLPTSSSPL